MAHPGIFITFEGIDGCGKTTQLHLLAEKLRRDGCEVVETIEPGGTAIGRQIRRILLDPESIQIEPKAELLLYFASRAQNVDQVIRPALARGAVVLCDRFTDSTLVYQGSGRGVPAEDVLTLDRIACGGLKPERTVLIDIDLETSLARAHHRNAQKSNAQKSNAQHATAETRIDEESLDFHRRVREGYIALAARNPERIVVADGRGGIAAVAERVLEAVLPLVAEHA